MKYLCQSCGAYCTLDEKKRGVCLECGGNPNRHPEPAQKVTPHGN